MAEKEQIILDENEQIAQRKAKLAALRKKGKAFPNDFRPDTLSEEIHRLYRDLINRNYYKLLHLGYP